MLKLCRMLLCSVLLLAMARTLHAQAYPTVDIPKLDNIAIDGNGDDWADRGMQVNMLTSRDRPTSPANLSSQLRIGWNDRGLLLRVTVRDDTIVENPADLFMGDSIELVAAQKHGSALLVHLGVRPGLDAKPGKPQHKFADKRPKNARTAPLSADLASAATKDGYIIEALLPWTNIGVQPAEGVETAFTVFVNDIDELGTRRQQQIWFPKGWGSTDAKQLFTLRLAKAPSAPMAAVATGTYENWRRLSVDVLATPDLAGRKAKLVESSTPSRVLAEGVLKEEPGTQRVRANLTMPLPPVGKSLESLTVLVDDHAALPLDLLDLPAARKRALAGATLRTAAVFTDREFPAIEFEQPLLVEELAGRYTLTTTYYDAQYNPVTVAEKPGRYGAIVQLKTDSGESRTWMITLFRQPKSINWWRSDLTVNIPTLPPELGIETEVVTTQSRTLSDLGKNAVADHFLRNISAGSVLAWLNETKPGSPPARDRTSYWAADQAWWFPLRKKLGMVNHRYIDFLPQGYDKDPNAKWPLVLFLHGSGERGDNLQAVRKNGLPKLVQTRTDFPFIMIAPQCPRDTWWNVVDLNDLLDEAIKKYRIDPDRIYVTGLSMGGYGTWSLLQHYPDRFAAAAPVCGGGDHADVDRIKDIPVWIFHGDKDQVVSYDASIKFFDALKKIGGRVKFTTYAGVAHNSWDDAYDTDELYTWLLAQKRSKPQQSRANLFSKTEVVTPP